MDEVRSKSCRKRKVCETRSEERKKNKRQTWKQAKKIYQLKNQHQSVTIYKFFFKAGSLIKKNQRLFSSGKQPRFLSKLLL